MIVTSSALVSEVLLDSLKSMTEGNRINRVKPFNSTVFFFFQGKQYDPNMFFITEKVQIVNVKKRTKPRDKRVKGRNSFLKKKTKTNL